MNDYTTTSIVFGSTSLVCFVALIAITLVKEPNPQLNKFITNTLNSGKFKEFFPITGYTLVALLAGVFLVIFIVTMGIGMGRGVNSIQETGPGIDRDPTTIDDLKETFGFGSGKITYKPIGYGPVLDKTKVRNWLNNGNPKDGKTTWKDGNGDNIQVPEDRFKSLYGYIPPSLSYYPNGQSGVYNVEGDNYKLGRENCMKACSLTNCIAVQTEVPENCSQQQSVSSAVKSCGSNSEYSCTLFYNNIQNADDAYWELENIGSSNSTGCFGSGGNGGSGETGSCMGKKYYEASSTPIKLPNTTGTPNGTKPSESAVRFCDDSVTKTNAAGYGQVGTNTCSCSYAGPCTDTNCCIMRPLLTTEHVQKKYPYYTLPVDISKVKAGGDSSEALVPSVSYTDGIGKSCGLVGNKLVSCSETNVCKTNGIPTENCWKVDTNTATSKCSGDLLSATSTEATSALNKYKNKMNAGDDKNYSDLYQSCYYRQKLSTVIPVQFGCTDSNVQIGCWGSPPVIYTNSLSGPGNFGACSDSSIISNTERCQSGGEGNIYACAGFPYSCGTNNGSNTLWTTTTK